MDDDLTTARLAAIVESADDAIISKNLQSVIQTWNPAAELLFGYTAEEAIGQTIHILIPDELHSEEATIIAKIKAGERIKTYETIRRRKDGSLVPVSLTISPIRDKNGDIIGASKIARDITAAKDSEKRIRLLLKEVNHRVKNQFAVILSMVRETGLKATDPADFQQQVRDRIMSLSRVHDLLVDAEWLGASIVQLIRNHLETFPHSDLVTVSGPEMLLLPVAVQSLGMALHELGTNSTKYGVFATGKGRLAISWRTTTRISGEPGFELTWEEHFAEPKEIDGSKAGFGTRVLTRVTPQSLMGSASLERTQTYVKWVVEAPLQAMSVDASPVRRAVPGSNAG